MAGFSCSNHCQLSKAVLHCKSFSHVLAQLYRVQGAIVVTLTSALASHFKVLRQSFICYGGMALSGRLSCTGTGLVFTKSCSTLTTLLVYEKLNFQKYCKQRHCLFCKYIV